MQTESKNVTLAECSMYADVVSSIWYRGQIVDRIFSCFIRACSRIKDCIKTGRYIQKEKSVLVLMTAL